MVPKTLVVAFMASCFVSSSSASPCKASSTSTEISLSTEVPTSTAIPTTIETTLAMTESESDIETSTAPQDSATSTVAEEATPISFTNTASATTQPTAPVFVEIDCSTDQDCIAALGPAALGTYGCVDLICQPTAAP